MKTARLFLPLGALLTAFVLFAPSVYAQEVLPKYWIFFEDKGEAAGKATVPEAGYLDVRAQSRRARRGSEVDAARRDAPLAPAYLDAVKALGAEPLVESRWLNAVSARLRPGQVADVRRLPSVRAVRLVGRTSVPTPPDLPKEAGDSENSGGAAFGAGKSMRLEYGPSATQLAVMNAIAPLERDINGAGVRLGFLDTEFGDFQHPVFARLRADGRLIKTENFAQGPQRNRHGEAVASTAVGYAEGSLIGPAWGAEVLAATTEYAPSETNQEEDNFVAGMEWMERNGADVVNVSLGYTTFDEGERSYSPDDLDGDTGITTRIVDVAASLGVVVVTSAGNSATIRQGRAVVPCTDHDAPEGCWYYIGTPADADSAIAVGAVTSDSVRAPFSSFGPTADGRTKPDVAAQGVGVVVADETDRYGFSNGTSFSSPLVAAVVCQILQVNPDLNPIDVRDLLRATASQSGNAADSLGWGIVNAELAIQNATPVATEPGASELPEDVRVVRRYPNPSRARVALEVEAPLGAGAADVRLYNLLGQQQAPRLTQPLQPGLNTLILSTDALAPGLYLYVVETASQRLTGSVTVVR